MTADRSVSDVLQDILRNVQDILRSEVRLAKAEIRQEATQAASAALWMTIGVTRLLSAWILLLWTAAYAGGGALLAAMLRTTAAQHAVASSSQDQLRAFSRNGVDGREQALELWSNIKSALIGVAAMRITDYISELVPGFDEQFRRAAQNHEAPHTR